MNFDIDINELKEELYSAGLVSDEQLREALRDLDVHGALTREDADGLYVELDNTEWIDDHLRSLLRDMPSLPSQRCAFGQAFTEAVRTIVSEYMADEVIATPPAQVGDGYRQDEPERDVPESIAPITETTISVATAPRNYSFDSVGHGLRLHMEAGRLRNVRSFPVSELICITYNESPDIEVQYSLDQAYGIVQALAYVLGAIRPDHSAA